MTIALLLLASLGLILLVIIATSLARLAKIASEPHQIVTQHLDENEEPIYTISYITPMLIYSQITVNQDE